MNRAELRSNLRRHLSEAGGAIHDDTRMNAELNRSARNLAAERALLKRQVQLSTVDGAAALPADAVGVLRVYHNTGRYDLRPIQPDHTPMPGEAAGYRPEWFSYDPTWGAGLSIYPARSVALTVNILSGGDLMDDDTDQPWNGAHEGYHDLVALHAAYMLSGQSGPGAAREPVWYQRYMQRMDEFRAAIAMQRITTRPMRLGAPQRRYP